MLVFLLPSACDVKSFSASADGFVSPWTESSEEEEASGDEGLLGDDDDDVSAGRLIK